MKTITIHRLGLKVLIMVCCLLPPVGGAATWKYHLTLFCCVIFFWASDLDHLCEFTNVYHNQTHALKYRLLFQTAFLSCSTPPYMQSQIPQHV